MIFGVAVNLPQIVKLCVCQNIFDAQQRSHHGVVLIVVFMHAITADEMQIRITRVQFLPDRSDVPRVLVVVNGISLFLADNAAFDEVPFFRQSNPYEFALGELN